MRITGIMGNSAKIQYNGFWDRPLGFVVRYKELQIYFGREYDDERDDYQDSYSVFVLPGLSDEEVKSSWGKLRQLATQYVGQVQVEDVVFDASFRESIDTDILDSIIDKYGLSRKQ
jgi:hypothetical protein